VRPDVLAEAARLSAEGRPFVLATVVWSRSPSSGKPGATALITPDRRVRGWIGGACAEPTVLREALKTLEDGEPCLLFLGSPEELRDHARAGVVTVPIACASEGALEVYVEPVLPTPHLVVIGRSPAVDALARMAAGLGWRAAVVDDGGDPSAHEGVATVVDRLDLVAAGVTASSCVVVATQGHYDEDALEAAIASGAAYVGLVASRKRAASVLGYLRDRGVSEEDLARVHAPAGLDLGRLPSQEIAVAILAELVQLRAAGALPVPAAVPAEARHEEIDPVCGMTVDVAEARFRTSHEGRTYYFCSAGCLAQFTATPEAYPATTG
jgi:xanthine dehydrogenase accessory factor